MQVAVRSSIAKADGSGTRIVIEPETSVVGMVPPWPPLNVEATPKS